MAFISLSRTTRKELTARRRRARAGRGTGGHNSGRSRNTRRRATAMPEARGVDEGECARKEGLHLPNRDVLDELDVRRPAGGNLVEERHVRAIQHRQERYLWT